MSGFRQNTVRRHKRNGFDVKVGCSQGCNNGGTIPRTPNDYGGAEKSQQCHKYFLQYSTFASERLQVRTWGFQTRFLHGRHLTSLRPWLFLNVFPTSRKFEAQFSFAESPLYREGSLILTRHLNPSCYCTSQRNL